MQKKYFALTNRTETNFGFQFKSGKNVSAEFRIIIIDEDNLIKNLAYEKDLYWIRPVLLLEETKLIPKNKLTYTNILFANIRKEIYKLPTFIIKKAIHENYVAAKYLIDPEIKEKIELIKRNPKVIEFFEKKNVEMCYYCLDKSPETFQHFQGLFPYLDNYAIEKYPHLIKYLKKPTIKHCYLAIKNCLENIRYINNKPKLFKKKIVKLSGVNLQYFREEEIDPEMVKIALENFPKALKYVPKKFVTREMIKDVFNKEPGIILFLSGELINSLAIDQNLHYLYRLFI